VGMRYEQKRWVVQGGYQGFRYQRTHTLAVTDSQSVTISPQWNLGQVYVRGSWVMWPQRPRFRVVGGLAYAVQARRNVFVRTETGIPVGGASISAEDFGEVEARVGFSAWRPYAGLAWDIPLGKSWFWQTSVGAAYHGKPRLEVKYTGFLETTNLSEDIRVIENNLRPYRYFPSVQLGIARRLR